MIPTFRKLSNEFGKTLYWAHIYLRNGVYMSYPGHGGFLDSFAPRRYPWITQAKDSPTWTLPQINTNTGFLTFTVSQRLYQPDGSFFGVLAVDILFVEALQKSALSPLWASDAHSFIVTTALNPATHQPELQILAQKDYQHKSGSWAPVAGKKWLSSTERIGFVLNNSRSDRPDIQRCPLRTMNPYGPMPGLMILSNLWQSCPNQSSWHCRMKPAKRFLHI
jgi:sigma-B regulation protein RsbU (phosphoserine phosphatase)